MFDSNHIIEDQTVLQVHLSHVFSSASVHSAKLFLLWFGAAYYPSRNPEQTCVKHPSIKHLCVSVRSLLCVVLQGVRDLLKAVLDKIQTVPNFMSSAVVQQLLAAREVRFSTAWHTDDGASSVSRLWWTEMQTPHLSVTTHFFCRAGKINRCIANREMIRIDSELFFSVIKAFWAEVRLQTQLNTQVLFIALLHQHLSVWINTRVERHLLLKYKLRIIPEESRCIRKIDPRIESASIYRRSPTFLRSK